MADGRKNNGGPRPNSGRPKKADEITMIQRMDATLAPDEVWQALADKVLKKDTQAIKCWLGYRYGQPKQSVQLDGDLGITSITRKIVKNGK